MSLNNRDKAKVRMQLNFTKDYSVQANTTPEGYLMFTKLRHFNKQASAYRLPREAEVNILSMAKQDDGSIEVAHEDGVSLKVQQYEYLLDLIRQRIEHIKVQPGAMTRSDLLEEHAFAVDLICTLDI
jgi:hypothetical protein